MVVRTARSRLAPVKGKPSDNSASGSEVKRCCACSRAERDTKQVVHNGLQLLRVRYGLPYCELPDCEVSELSRLLSFLLLQGKERPPVAFPRRQGRKREIDGLCNLQRLDRRSRWELAHSMSSIKRNLPAGCRRCTPSKQKEWESSACFQPPPPSEEYLDHVRRVVTSLFPASWDGRYDSFVGNHLPNPSARKEKRSRADLLWSGRRSEFLRLATTEQSEVTILQARYKEILSAGKVRPMLIFDEFIDLLGPLHKLLYSHLRQYDWVLCGPPTAERMASVCANEYQTSVDLVNATDGLHHLVAEVILDCAFFSSLKIPRSIRSLAKASLSPIFVGHEGYHRRVRHGQMMGSYLSFPLLCLQSYCAATWAARFDPNARFLVNGDDCVISASRGVTVQDYPSGMRLNSDKTIIARNVVEVNSTAFLRTRGGWREVRHLRRGGALTDYSGMLHMASAVLKSGPQWVDAYQRARIGRRWGFLPSQIGHLSYAAYKRERQMLRRRNFTALPSPTDVQDLTSLRKVTGRDPTPVEAEALRSFFWEHGRRGGLKRDVWDPSCGSIRRTYSYRARPCISYLSFVVTKSMSRLQSQREKSSRFFLLPEEFETIEEMESAQNLAELRSMFCAGILREEFR
ncbi:RNA-dependent RNA polymerase [Erysiphe necator associated ourmia-like virus 61]|nr:RNA-dependent RNA polymerase [Erysiphe necator associated ourmia-like virus 61]